ncbi:MAG: type III pantothenate kinase [Proteobacteria bacterium]|nr:type III pantothenate kinase [Pseudomonadota bacterium]
MTACLQMDVGNSSAKWRLVRGGDVVARGKYLPGDAELQEQLLNSVATLGQIWISSVASPQAETKLTDLLVDKWGVQPWYARTQAKTMSLVNSYTNPARMGVDRWLAMLAAHDLIEGRVCVVDAGSALTIDIVAEDGLHEGGYIIPGPELMERALLLDTDRVRFAEDAIYDLAPGKSTAEAVRHGIAVAQAGAVGMVLEQMKIGQNQLLICGGGGDTLQSLLGGVGLQVPDLVFDGLTLMADLSSSCTHP